MGLSIRDDEENSSHAPAFAVGGAFPEFFSFGIVDKLAGFGIAANDGVGAVGDVAEVAHHGAVLTFVDGTVECSFASNGIEDLRSDIWAWGNVAYELVTGKRPFTGKTVHETMTAMVNSEAVAPYLVEPKCHRVLSDVISRSLVRDPSKRFQSADELMKALDTVTC